MIRLLPRTDVPAFASEKKLFLLVKTAFNQRRKTLRNALRGLFEPDVLDDPLFDLRAEALSVEQFAELSFRMR
jgi:16S rRNA (adenine1518-N6/adenine1519-N6)-dimethyltransferase